MLVLVALNWKPLPPFWIWSGVLGGGRAYVITVFSGTGADAYVVLNV